MNDLLLNVENSNVIFIFNSKTIHIRGIFETGNNYVTLLYKTISKKN